MNRARLFCPVKVGRNVRTGEVKAIDINETEWFVTHWDGTPLTDSEAEKLMDENMSLFDISPTFKVERIYEK